MVGRGRVPAAAGEWVVREYVVPGTPVVFKGVTDPAVVELLLEHVTGEDADVFEGSNPPGLSMGSDGSWRRTRTRSTRSCRRTSRRI